MWAQTTNTTKEHSVYISCANTLYTVHLTHPGKHLPYSHGLLYIMQGFLSNVYQIGDVAFFVPTKEPTNENSY